MPVLRRITSAKVTKLALCKRGKNGLTTLYKAQDGNGKVAVEVLMLSKGMTEEGLLTAVVYAPETPDGDGHVASAEVIQNAAYDFLRNPVLNIAHEGEDLDPSAARVVESFIIQKNDARFADLTDYNGKPVGDLAGAWGVVVKIDDEGLRKAYRTGRWQGISLEGFGTETLLKNDEDDLDEKDTTMTPAEIAALTGSLQTTITSALAPLNERLTKLEKAAKDEQDTTASKAAEDKAAAEEARKVRLRKARRLDDELSECVTDTEEELVLKKAELSELRSKLTGSIADDKMDDARDLRSDITKLRKAIEPLQKKVDEDRTAREKEAKKTNSPLGTPLRKSANNGKDEDKDTSRVGTLGRLVGLEKSASSPEEGSEDEQAEILEGSLMGMIGTRLSGGTVTKN